MKQRNSVTLSERLLSQGVGAALRSVRFVTNQAVEADARWLAHDAGKGHESHWRNGAYALLRLHLEEGRVVRHGELELQLACAIDDSGGAKTCHRKRIKEAQVRAFFHANG